MPTPLFGLSRQPFRSLPDTDSYYPATTHEICLHDIERAYSDGEFLCLIRAQAGMGKTLLLRRFLESLDDANIERWLIIGSTFTGPRELFQTILFEAGQSYNGKTEHECRLAVHDLILKAYEGGGRTILAVDEAHHLNAACLEELRLLSNLTGNRGPAIQVILAALPNVWNSIDRSGMESFLQRLAVRPELQPLDEDEASDYLIHQLRWAGAKRPEQILEMDAVRLFANRSRGIPRLLNQLAHTAMELAADNGLTSVDYEAALEAIHMLGLAEAEIPDETPPAKDRERTERDTIKLSGHRDTTVASKATPHTAKATIVQQVEVGETETTIPFAETADNIGIASAKLQNGKLVAFPMIVDTDVFPPRYIYDGSIYVSDPIADAKRLPRTGS